MWLLFHVVGYRIHDCCVLGQVPRSQKPADTKTWLLLETVGEEEVKTGSFV